jgi:hypothetical protein
MIRLENSKSSRLILSPESLFLTVEMDLTLAMMMGLAMRRFLDCEL